MRQKREMHHIDNMCHRSGIRHGGWSRLFRCLCLMLTGMLLLGGCGKRTEGEVRVGSLKGPTSLGLLFLMDSAKKGETSLSYEFQMAVGAEELLGLMTRGELDIALVPANVAAVFYQKSEGGIAVVDINTLGVLYLVTGDSEVDSVMDLKGRTIYLTGKGTTPEAVLLYILKQNGFNEGDCILEYKSEATEVAALLAENPDGLGLLPQPFATAAMMQNQKLKEALDMNKEWERLQEDGSSMVTGVTVVRREFLEEHEDRVKVFLKDHQESAAAINENPEEGAALSVAAGIVAREEIAKQAIPFCNITCVTGAEMKERLQGYLAVLADFRQELVGGSLPGEDFYYNGDMTREGGRPDKERPEQR